MVKNSKQTRFKGSNIISASEIGQYCYCSISWYLQKCGYKPESHFLDLGKERHVKLGRIIYHTQVTTKKSRFFSIVGYFLLIIAILIIIYGVIS
jgi:hypothetical protein